MEILENRVCNVCLQVKERVSFFSFPDGLEFEICSSCLRAAQELMSSKKTEEKEEVKPYSCSPYFDQQEPEIEVLGLIADEDRSPSYELEAMAVFKAKNGYLVVFVSGCSCWPDRGYTEQYICPRKADVDKILINSGYSTLIGSCQAKGWRHGK